MKRCVWCFAGLLVAIFTALTLEDKTGSVGDGMVSVSDPEKRIALTSEDVPEVWKHTSESTQQVPETSP